MKSTFGRGVDANSAGPASVISGFMKIVKIEPTMTMVGGRVVFEAPSVAKAP